jgi:two-component system cell cycle response regulator DivK
LIQKVKPEMARILIVDDIATNIDLLEQILDEVHEISTAFSGEEALESIQDLRPDLILMDVALPGISGLEATRAIKAMPGLANIPIIAVTSHAMRGDRAKALEAGCDYYLTKPVDEDLLLKTIAEHLCDPAQ